MSPICKVRCMKADEIHRVAELIRSLQFYQKMKDIDRIPSGENLQGELIRIDEKSGTRIPNNNNVFVSVAVDESRLNEPNLAYVVGYMIYSQAFSILHGRQFYMNSFFIEEAYRRIGLGGKFMEYLRLNAKAMGNDILDVPFMKANEIGKKFYANYGSYLVNEEYTLMKKKL